MIRRSRRTGGNRIAANARKGPNCRAPGPFRQVLASLLLLLVFPFRRGWLHILVRRRHVLFLRLLHELVWLRIIWSRGLLVFLLGRRLPISLLGWLLIVRFGGAFFSSSTRRHPEHRD